VGSLISNRQGTGFKGKGRRLPTQGRGGGPAANEGIVSKDEAGLEGATRGDNLAGEGKAESKVQATRS